MIDFNNVMKTKVFARLNTDTKVILRVNKSNTRSVLIALSKEFGGDWVVCDELKANEIIPFGDGIVYKGFEEEKDRFCNVQTLNWEEVS